MSHRAKLLPALLAAAVLGAGACSDRAGNGGALGSAPVPATIDLDTGDLQLTSALQVADSCDDLLARIKAEALERVGPYGFDNYGPVMVRDMEEGDAVATGEDARGAPEPVAPSAAPATTAASAEAAPGADRAQADTDTGAEAAGDTGSGTDASGAQDTSGTNNQEAGVDEADLVKTDGERLVVLSGNLLRVIDVTGDTPVLVRQIPLPPDTVAGEMFLDGDHVLLMSSSFTDRPFVGREVQSDWYPGSPTGRLIEVDLAAGEVVRTLEFEGGYLSAREVDGTIRVVMSAASDRFAFVYPSNESANESAEAANRALIESSTIDQWLPTYRVLEDGTEVDAGPLVDCERVYLPSEFAGFGSLVLLTVDLSDGLDLLDATSVFTDAQTVYASPTLVAVATPRWPVYNPDGSLAEDEDDAFSTAVHTFDITDPTRAGYVASGAVPGHLLNQYSLSEHDGYLRVATTAGSPWFGGGAQSESVVTVLGREDAALVPVGQVGGLGKGEQIYAVRFLGPKAYVVTFRQTDPLYTVDLSDPTNPRVTGELKIPGFSSYLHPIDDAHVLGVGTDGDDQGNTGGTVLSMFDVSDPTNPTLTTKLAIGPGGPGDWNNGSATPVSYDARAFTFWRGRAVVPVSWWRYNPDTGAQANGSEAVVVTVGDDGSLDEVGRVSHPSTQYCEGGVTPLPVEGDGGVGVTTAPAPAPAGTIVPDNPDEGSTTTATAAVTTTAGSEAVVTTTTGSEATIEPQPGPTFVPGPVPCYTQAPEIVRSLIIGDDLYTVSSGGVAVNSYESLAAITWIPFG